jgi:hypothetical protein
MAFFTQAIAFVITVAIVIATARWLEGAYNSRVIAVLGAAIVGIVLSITSDFTITFSIDQYDRSLHSVAERAGMAGVLALIIGFLALRSRASNSS